MANNKINTIAVLHLDREDITEAGFDADSVSDNQLQEIADSLNEYYLDNFSSVLYDTCKLHKVKPLDE